jgi:2,4-dienoyl-CoA reductase (NADPH2)
LNFSAFTWVTKKLKGEIGIPLCTTNRINMPAVAESVLASGAADMISMARPFLADPHFVKKAMEGRVDEINTCIGTKVLMYVCTIIIWIRPRC